MSQSLDNTVIISSFYTAFQKRDYKKMQSLYHDNATFSDPIFSNLNAKQVKAMWQMLLTTGKDLTVTFSNVDASDGRGLCHWDAFYTFSRTGNKVHNIVDADFEFLDGKILKHTDHFNFWKWSRQAFGLTGVILGWTSVFHNKVRTTAQEGLSKFIAKSAANS
ncbi:MAG: nuclear transport factor 2 family protein [Chryseolinea sp.]